MDSMEQLYSNIIKNNILNNDEYLVKLLDLYKRSKRPTYNLRDGRATDFYDFLVDKSDSKHSEINFKDYETFYIKMTNRWIKNILSLTQEELIKFKKKGLNLYPKIKEILQSSSEVHTLRDIQTLYNKFLNIEDELTFEKNGYFWRSLQESTGFNPNTEYANDFIHIDSRYLNIRRQPSENHDYRLYVNCDNSEIFKLIDLYVYYCELNNIPYYFKYQTDEKRKDKFLIYCSKENLKNNIFILKQIGKEHPEIIEKCGATLDLVGSIDNWIGIASEPKKNYDIKHSFNTLRGEIFEDAAEEMMINFIKENLRKKITISGKQYDFNELLINQIINELLTDMEKKGYSSKQIRTNNFISYLKQFLLEKSKTGLQYILLVFKKLDDISSIKNKLCGSNSNAIYEIKMPDGTFFKVDTYLADRILKSFVPLLIESNPNFIQKYREEIRKKCSKYKVDPNSFCLNDGSFEDFKKLDNTPSNLVFEEKKETISETTTIHKGNWNKINFAYIQGVLSMLPKELLEIKVKNGIRLKQYAEEIIVDQMGDNYNYITDNGTAIPATLLIQQIIAEHQSKLNNQIEINDDKKVNI